MDRVGNTRESFLGGPRVTVVTRLAQTAAVRWVIRVHSPGHEFFPAQRVMTATVADAMTQITQIGSRSSPISPFVAASLAHWSLLGATATARPKPPPPASERDFIEI